MRRFSKWAFYWMLALISVVFAESFSGSTPIIISDVMTWLFYGLHYFLLMDFLVRRNAITWPTLAVAGLVLGFTTESILTKVIWNPPYNAGEETLRILGLGVFEVGFTVTTWHVWMSTALPIAFTLQLFGLAEMFNPQQWRRLLRWLPISLWLIASFGIIDPLTFLVMIVTNGLTILAAIFIYRLLPPVTSLENLILARWERGLIIGLLVILYTVGWFEFRPEAIPTLAPFILGMSLVIGSIVLLFILRRRYADMTPQPSQPSFTYWRWVKYMAYFTTISMIVTSIGFFALPISTAVTLLGILLFSLRSNWYLRGITFRRNPRNDNFTPEPLSIMPRPTVTPDFTG